MWFGTGCTEPISLALAAATAAKYLGKTPERIEAKVSPNLMKNGLGVAVTGNGHGEFALLPRRGLVL